MAPDVLSRFLSSNCFRLSISMYLARHVIGKTLIFDRINPYFLPCFDRHFSRRFFSFPCSSKLRHCFITEPIVCWSSCWSSFGCLAPSHHILILLCVTSIVYQVLWLFVFLLWRNSVRERELNHPKSFKALIESFVESTTNLKRLYCFSFLILNWTMNLMKHDIRSVKSILLN